VVDNFQTALPTLIKALTESEVAKIQAEALVPKLNAETEKSKAEAEKRKVEAQNTIAKARLSSCTQILGSTTSKDEDIKICKDWLASNAKN
jgi:hypothetical protein